MPTSDATVFVVDPDPRSLGDATCLAKKTGWPVRAFSSLRAFLKGCSPEACGCLILEVSAGALDTPAAVEQLARRGFSLPTVIVTEDGDVPSRTRAFAMGVCDVLGKPIEEKDFYASFARAAASLLAAECTAAADRYADGTAAACAAFGKLFAGTSTGASLVGESGRLLAVNEAFCRDFGYSREELLAKTMADLTHPEDFARETPRIAECLAGRRRSYSLSKRCRRKDGSVFAKWITVAFIRTEHGGVFGLGVGEPLPAGHGEPGIAAAPPQPAVPGRRDGGQVGSDLATVFLVADNPLSPGGARRLLENTGLAVRHFTSVPALLESAAPGMSGCLVIDLAAPQLDAAAVVEPLRQGGISLPTLFVIDGEEKADDEGASRGGRDDLQLVERPIDAQVFYDLLWKAVACFLAAEHLRDRHSQGSDLATACRLYYAPFADSTVGIALVDAPGRLLAVNAAFCRGLGYSEEELLGTTIAEITHPADGSGEAALIDEVLEGRRDAYCVAKRYIAKNGSVVQGRIMNSVIRTPGGAVYALAMIEWLSTGGEVGAKAPPGPGAAAAAEEGGLAGTAAEGSKQASPRTPLTPREQQVIPLLIEGKTIKQIAHRLDVSVQAIWRHRQNIFEKFGVENEVQLVRRIAGPP